MEKVVRLTGTLLVLILIFVACKKDELADGKGDFLASKKKNTELAENPGYRGSMPNDPSQNTKKITICHNDHDITISVNAVVHHFKEHPTDLMFSCDPSQGVVYEDVLPTLYDIIADNSFTGNEGKQLQNAFEVWYSNYYLVGNWPIVTDNGDGGSGDPQTPTMGVCHDGQLIIVSYAEAYSYFENGDILFSCDPGAGIFFSDVEGPLLDIIYDYGLNESASDVMYQAFVIWYNDYFLSGNWPPDAGGAGGGGAGGGDGGAGTGTDSTVVINN